MTNQETTIYVDDEALAKAFIGVQSAAGKKAENIRVLDLRGVSGFTNFFLICSGHSDRQVKAIADSIDIELREQGVPILSIEGYHEGRWIVMDYGEMVVHVFLDALRDYYDLENLWYEAKRVPIPTELFYAPSDH